MSSGIKITNYQPNAKAELYSGNRERKANALQPSSSNKMMFNSSESQQVDGIDETQSNMHPLNEFW